MCVHALILQRSSASLPSGELCRDVKTASSAAASHGVAKVENQNWTMWKRCVYIYIPIFTYLYIYIHIKMRMYVCMHACMYVCICVCICMYMFVYLCI